MKDRPFSNSKAIKGKRIFYGWWIVACGTVVMALQSGLYWYGFSVYFAPLKEEFGWTATALSAAFAVGRLESGIAGPAVGFLIDRFGTKVPMIIGFIMAGGGFILLAQVNSIEMFYVVFVLVISVGGSLAFSAPINAATANWFIKRRGLAFGIMTSGVGLGGFCAPALAWIIGQYGWRWAAIASGIVFLAAGLPVALIIRHRPEPYGYLPDDASPQTDDGKAEGPAEGDRRQGQARGAGARKVAAAEIGEEVSFSPKQAIVTSAFWLIALVFTIRQVITNGVAIHQIPALVNMGYSPEVAAGVLAITTTLSVPGRLIFGWLGDRWDKRYAIAICLAMQLLGLYAFAYAGDTLMLIVFLVVYSPAYGAFLPLMPATWGTFFGRKRFATISGLAQMITMWGTIAGPLLAGYAFDVSGSYQWAILFFAIVNAPALIFLLFVRRPRLNPLTQVAPT